MNENWMNTAQAARSLGVSVATLKRWINFGKLVDGKVVYLIPREKTETSVKITESDIRRFREQCEKVPA